MTLEIVLTWMSGQVTDENAGWELFAEDPILFDRVEIKSRLFRPLPQRR